MSSVGRRQPTTTSNFGVSKRESHDSSAFYARFVAPALSDEDYVDPKKDIDDIFAHSATSMSEVKDASVALVVTSPPYFAGKQYEEALGQGEIPATYSDYLAMLEAVFDECVNKLEPGGRIAVNVANLGRKPYRSLASDVIWILQDRLQLLLRGEVIWQKARGSASSCAWGSFQKPANPVLRDLTERVVIASKGRFDRALTPKQRRESEPSLPYVPSLSRDEFMEATTDVWEIPPESARRVDHPAPFPVELPARLIDLYTYYDDLVLDPFMGSGTTAVAAVAAGRHFVGYDTDEAYVKRAKKRVEKERARVKALSLSRHAPLTFALPSAPDPAPQDEFFQSRAVREGRAAKDVARALLERCGFHDLDENLKLLGGVELNFKAYDAKNEPWYFDVSGGFTSNRPGLKRTDTLWKALGKAAVLHQLNEKIPLVLLTTDAPSANSAGDAALQQMRGRKRPVADVIRMLDSTDVSRLALYAVQGRKALA